MALTPEQRARLQALTSDQQAAPATSPSRLTPEQQARLQAFTDTAPQPTAPPPREGALYRAASFVNRGVEKFANLPVIKQVGQATGAALGGVGGVIGGGVAAVGTPIVNIAQGKPVFENYGAQIKKNAMDTGGFAFQLGEQAPTLGAMQTLGRAPNLVLGAAQTLEGYKQTKEALKSGDTAGAIQAGITTGIGAAGTLLGLRQKGLFLDEGFKNGTKARLKGTSVDELNTQKYTKVMEDVLQPNKSTVKRETKGILAQARKERAGMSVAPQKTTARVLVEAGVVPGVVDEGGTTKFRTAEQVVDMDNRVADANDKLEQALAFDPNPQFDLEAKKLETTRLVDDVETSATEKKAMKAEVEKFFDDEIEARGQFVDGLQYNKIKRNFAKVGDYKNLTPGQKHMRQVAESIAKDIETRYADKFNVKEVNRTIGNYIRARNELQTLDGSVVKGGGLSRKLAQLGGAVIAGPLSNIPLVDNIVGGYLAGKVQQYAVSPARKLSGLDGANISNPAPDVLNTAEEGARSAAARQAALPRLPAPRESRVPGPLSQYIPSKSGLLSQAEARTKLGIDVARPESAIPLPEPKADLPTPKEATQIRRAEARALQEQLQSFRYPTGEMEDGYRAFKLLADRSKEALDEVIDADAFATKYGKDRTRTIIENAVGGGEMTNNEILDTYRMRYRTEQSVKAQIERMKQGQPQVLSEEDVAVFALAPLGGIEITYDEEGKPQYSFNTEKSLGSLALGAGIIAGKKGLKKLQVPDGMASALPPKLLNEAKKYKTVDSFIAAMTKQPYGMDHRPTITGATADEISQLKHDMGLPKDFYQKPEYYADMDSQADKQSFSALKSIRGNPDAEVVIYRAAPKNEFNFGDWVSLSKEYAKGESLSEGTKVYSKKVKAKDIQFAGDSINEFGFYPNDRLSELTNAWNQANKNTPK